MQAAHPQRMLCTSFVAGEDCSIPHARLQLECVCGLRVSLMPAVVQRCSLGFRSAEHAHHSINILFSEEVHSSGCLRSCIVLSQLFDFVFFCDM